jgi:hypothetical protein
VQRHRRFVTFFLLYFQVSEMMNEAKKVL